MNELTGRGDRAAAGGLRVPAESEIAQIIGPMQHERRLVSIDLPSSVKLYLLIIEFLAGRSVIAESIPPFRRYGTSDPSHFHLPYNLNPI